MKSHKKEEVWTTNIFTPLAAIAQLANYLTVQGAISYERLCKDGEDYKTYRFAVFGKPEDPQYWQPSGTVTVEAEYEDISLHMYATLIGYISYRVWLGIGQRSEVVLWRSEPEKVWSSATAENEEVMYVSQEVHDQIQRASDLADYGIGFDENLFEMELLKIFGAEQVEAMKGKSIRLVVTSMGGIPINHES